MRCTQSAQRTKMTSVCAGQGLVVGLPGLEPGTSSLSGIEGLALCYPPFLEVIGLRNRCRDGVNCDRATLVSPGGVRSDPNSEYRPATIKASCEPISSVLTSFESMLERTALRPSSYPRRESLLAAEGRRTPIDREAVLRLRSRSTNQ
jgi:hypothetical protein